MVTGYLADDALATAPATADAEARSERIRPEAVERALDAFGGVRRPSNDLGTALDAELAAMAALGDGPNPDPMPGSGPGLGTGTVSRAAARAGGGGKQAGDGGKALGGGSVGASAVAALRAGVDRVAAAGSALVGGEAAQRFWQWLQVRPLGTFILPVCCALG